MLIDGQTVTPDWGKTSTSAGYRVVYCPDHPKAWSTGYVLEHRLVAEIGLGRFLAADEVVHHKNHDKHDNAATNLEVLTIEAHQQHHGREHSTFQTLVCDWCGNVFLRPRRQRAEIKGYKHKFCSRSCSGSYPRNH